MGNASPAAQEDLSISRAFRIAWEHHQKGRLGEAEAIYRQILQMRPSHVDAQHFLGVLAAQAGENTLAVDLMGRAIRADSSNSACYSNLGHALQSLGHLDQAVASYRQALALKPDLGEASDGLGSALLSLGEIDAAIASFHRALEESPDFAEAHNNLGRALQAQGKFAEAVASYQTALSLKPHFAAALNNLGTALAARGKVAEAMESYRRALACSPRFAAAHSNLIYSQAFTHDRPPEEQRDFAAQWETLVLTDSERIAARNRKFALPPRAGRRLKLGVVSAELGQHAVAEFLEPFLEHLDRNRFHITLFPTASHSGPRAARLQALADDFQPLMGVTDGKAADQIRASRIDLLIDTTSHMSGCRLGVFAHRAAPVQCHYIGHFGTTGLTEMDWILADENLLPPACDPHFRERIWRLPRLWISYRADTSLPPSDWKPDPAGAIWLGTFNNLAKVGDDTLRLWAAIMKELPESKLLLKDRRASDAMVQESIRRGLQRYGVESERIAFAHWTPDWKSHMRLYDRLDIGLDTIPLNSGTTAFDALWMGVPMAAIEGDWFGGRLTSTMLKALDRPEWIAHTEDEYRAIVIALARDVEGRKTLRAAQRSRMANSPLCDAKGLATSLADAFEAMVDAWAAKLAASAGR